MKILNFTLVCIALILFFESCNKEKKTIKRQTENLTRATWKLVDAKSKNSSGVWENAFPFIDTCRSDNLISYSPSNTYSIDEGPTKCYAIDPQNFASGSWTFQNNATQLLLDGVNEKTILVLNEDTLRYTEIGPSGWGTYEAELTYVH